MKLKTIKLSGFKSFVEPTTINLETNLTAIVGPNGCGKSNVVDAVRWVIGEISAKYLRADSMTGVIFNGTSTRQPVAQASVELVFDNSDASLGGKYASYAEIAIRRVLGRDGESKYFLNNVRCRRLDIIDIFLGTGLGPRSYAIIGQGTISTLIEAKPKEMSGFLQEAIGVSRYREQRRDTEARIRRTRENLERLMDLREEIDKQLNHLRRQAASAKRFKKLKKKERELKAKLLAILCRDLTNQASTETRQLAEEETRLEQKIAEQRGLDKDIESIRLQQTECSEKFNEIQTRYYRLTAEIARLEQRIQYVKERDKQILEDMKQIQTNMREITQNINDDKRQFEQLELDLKQVEPDTKLATNVAEESQARLEHEEQCREDWQLVWDEFIAKAAKSGQQVEVEQTRIQHLEQQLEITGQRQQRLEKSLSDNTIGDLPKQVSKLQIETDKLKEASGQAETKLNTLEVKITAQRELVVERNDKLAEKREALQNLRAQQTSFELLQKTAFTQDNKVELDRWLKTHEFSNYPQLAKLITVAKGWERATEMLLGSLLQAVCIPDFNNLSEKLNDFQQGALSLYFAEDDDAEDELSQTRFSARAVPFLEKIETDLNLRMLLKYVYAAKTVDDALALRGSLEAHESIVTKDGAWVGATWMRMINNTDAGASILECEKELERLAKEIPISEEALEKEEATLNEVRQTLVDLEKQRRETQATQGTLMAQFSDKRAEFNTAQTQLKNLTQRKITFEQEMQENQTQLLETEVLVTSARTTLEEAQQQNKVNESKRKELMERRDSHQLKFDDIRQQARTDRDVLDELSIRLESMRNQRHFLNQSIGRAEKQLLNLTARHEALEESKEQSAMPLGEVKTELATLLEQRVKIDSELNTSRAAVSSITQKSHELDAKYKAAAETVLAVRENLETLRLQQNSLQLKVTNHQEQVTEWGFELEEILNNLPESVSADECEKDLTRVVQRIESLGAINLAAIEDSVQLAERQTYLNSQNEDLEKALAMLENTIKKIDQETRVRFKEAYEKVNTLFQELFPRIFAGGKASLELDDNDLLTAGIVVKVQPPGKRNTTIYSLSGGEKALTAIALVFSFFQLNPAPFCMLDEVDAPLDDVNVGRFCDLLKEMSDKVQFIFITHNKLAMEMAKQLMGVTMRELGVSRMVSVDVDAAIEMVE